MAHRRTAQRRVSARARRAPRATAAALNRIFVIGASTGGIGALCTLVQDLPPGLPCAILIVQHGATDILVDILKRCHRDGHVIAPKDGEAIRPGYIFVAAPDHHLVVTDGHLQISKGPRENYHRPSVDVLFRSAARAYGPRVVGIVLTGAMEDGASGMFSVKAKGGIAVVHDPREAMMPDMPISAMNAVEKVDYCLPIAEMAPLIVKLAHQPVAVPRPRNPRLKSTEAETPMSDAAHPMFVCPECDGPLRMFREAKLLEFACKTGHRFTLNGLSEAHAETLERALWVALRVLEDRAAIQRMRAKSTDDRRQGAQLIEIADQAEHDAKLLRQVMERL